MGCGFYQERSGEDAEMKSPMIAQTTQAGQVQKRTVTLTLQFPQGMEQPTVEQWRLITAVFEHGTFRAASAATGRDEETISSVYHRYRPCLAEAVRTRS